MKLAIFLGIMLLLVSSAFAGYRMLMVAKIENLEIQLQTALNNQQVLENTKIRCQTKVTFEILWKQMLQHPQTADSR